MATYNHFYDLPVYNTCRTFRKKIFSLTRKYYSKSEEYHLKAQVPDSSRSITAYDEKYITKDILRELNKDYYESLKQLNGYIKYLKDAKSGYDK